MYFCRRAVPAIVLIFIFLLQPALIGWGERGHELVNRSAALILPNDMPGFLKANAEQLAYLGPEPDRWRERTMEPALYDAQAPEHFIDMERVSWMEQYPPTRHEFITRLYERRASVAMDKPDDLLPDKVGYQPYVVMEIYGRLKVAFREYRRLQAAKRPTAPAEANAIYYAGWLGHYVADASNPFHTTIHYDGWIDEKNPNNYRRPKGIHWEFESQFVSRHLESLKLDPLLKPPVRLADPWQEYLKYLRASHADVEKVYQMEKAGAFKEAGTPEGVAYVQSRLAAGAQMLANMWYTAWLESEKMPERRPRSSQPATSAPPAQ